MITIQKICHSYQKKEVLKGLDISIAPKEIFGLLGPNGSGKTTLFRILSTAMRPSSGCVRMDFGSVLTIPGDENKIREKTGIVFQSPSLDAKLTVLENLKHHGHLYGMSGTDLKARCADMLSRLGLEDRAGDRVEKLSGGLKRRTELAKALLHKPSLLILDEPSTGLDPGARIDLWRYLKQLREQQGITLLVTTHLMDEAEHCDRVVILNRGEIVKAGRPEELKRQISGDVIVVKTPEPEKFAVKIKEKLGVSCTVLPGAVQMEHEKGAEFIVKIAGAFASEAESITCRKPTLEDVFIHETGHKFWNEEEAAGV